MNLMRPNVRASHTWLSFRYRLQFRRTRSTCGGSPFGKKLVQQSSLTASHSRGVLGLSVVVAGQVEYAVDDVEE